MTAVSSDTTVSPQPVAPHRRRWAWTTIAAVGLLSASAFVAVPAIADGTTATPDGGGSSRVIVCETAVESSGDVGISAATATRLAVGDTTPVPEGCREG